MHPETLSPMRALPQPRCKAPGKGVCILKQGLWKKDLIPLSRTHAYTYTPLHLPSVCPRVPRPAQLAVTRDSGVKLRSLLLCSPRAAGGCTGAGHALCIFLELEDDGAIGVPNLSSLGSPVDLPPVPSLRINSFHPAFSPASITRPGLWAGLCLGRVQTVVPSA